MKAGKIAEKASKSKVVVQGNDEDNAGPIPRAGPSGTHRDEKVSDVRIWWYRSPSAYLYILVLVHAGAGVDQTDSWLYSPYKLVKLIQFKTIHEAAIFSETRCCDTAAIAKTTTLTT